MNEVNDIKEILKTNRHLVHGRNIIDRYKNTPQDANLNMIIRSYHNYIIGNNIEGWTDDIINRRTILLNKYYNFLHENNFDNNVDNLYERCLDNANDNDKVSAGFIGGIKDIKHYESK